MNCFRILRSQLLGIHLERICLIVIKKTFRLISRGTSQIHHIGVGFGTNSPPSEGLRIHAQLPIGIYQLRHSGEHTQICMLRLALRFFFSNPVSQTSSLNGIRLTDSQKLKKRRHMILTGEQNITFSSRDSRAMEIKRYPDGFFIPDILAVTSMRAHTVSMIR